MSLLDSVSINECLCILLDPENTFAYIDCVYGPPPTNRSLLKIDLSSKTNPSTIIKKSLGEASRAELLDSLGIAGDYLYLRSNDNKNMIRANLSDLSIDDSWDVPVFNSPNEITNFSIYSDTIYVINPQAAAVQKIEISSKVVSSLNSTGLLASFMNRDSPLLYTFGFVSPNIFIKQINVESDESINSDPINYFPFFITGSKDGLVFVSCGGDENPGYGVFYLENNSLVLKDQNLDVSCLCVAFRPSFPSILESLQSFCPTYYQK